VVRRKTVWGKSAEKQNLARGGKLRRGSEHVRGGLTSEVVERPLVKIRKKREIRREERRRPTPDNEMKDGLKGLTSSTALKNRESFLLRE